MRLSNREALLLRVVFGDAAKQAEAWHALRPGFDLDHLDPGSYALMPLLYDVVRELSPEDPLARRLKGIVRHTWYRNQTLLNQLGEIVPRLSAEGTEATVVRGASLACRFYPRPGSRAIGQLELLVAPDTLERARGVLAPSGWRAVNGRLSAYAGRQLRLSNGEGSCVLRTRLLARLPAPPADAELRLGSVVAPALGATEELLLACSGGLRERPDARLQALADAATIVHAAEAEIDWERLLEAAAVARVVPQLRETTACLRGLLDLRVPEHVLERLQRARPGSGERIAALAKTHYATPLSPKAQIARRLHRVVAPPAQERHARSAAAAGDAGAMRSRVVGGLGWKLVSQLATQLSKVLLAVVFARLLTPHEFGLAAEVLVFSLMAGAFSDFALGSALIQSKTIDETDRSTVFWTTLGTGALFTVGGFLLAGPIASIYREPDVRPLLMVASVSFGLIALSATQGALLVREMKFRRLELTRVASTAVSTPIGIAVAFLGFGAWAIISVQLSGAATATLLLWAFSSWRPRFRYSRESLRRLGAYGGKIFGSRFFFYLNVNADNFIVGRFLGAAALGSYSLAYNLTLLPVTRVVSPVQQVLFPAFSRLGEPARIGRAWLRGNRILVAVLTPAFLGMIVVAPDFVRVVLGDRWLESVPVLRVLSWVGIILAFQSLNQSLLQAVGEAGSLLRLAIVSSVTNVAAFLIGLHWGIVGVATCYAISRTVGLPLYTWFCCRAAKISLGDYARSTRGVLEAAGAMLALIVAARLLLLREGVPAPHRLAIVVVLGLVTYVPLLAWRAPSVVKELRRLKRPAREGPIAAVT